jgi:hypothetical protein
MDQKFHHHQCYYVAAGSSNQFIFAENSKEDNYYLALFESHLDDLKYATF